MREPRLPDCDVCSDVGRVIVEEPNPARGMPTRTMCYGCRCPKGFRNMAPLPADAWFRIAGTPAPEIEERPVASSWHPFDWDDD